MIIANAKIVLEDSIINGYIEFNDKVIVNIKKGKPKHFDIDAKGLYLLPAFIDSHTHGGYGLDFNMLTKNNCDMQIKKYLNHIHHEGVGSILMTTVTCSDKDLEAIAKNYGYIKSLDKTNVIKGWYIEGPYISQEYKGAHNPTIIRPLNVNEVQKIDSLTKGVIKILAVAPEVKDNLKKYKEISKKYFIATGHCSANYHQATQAFDLSAKRIIHLYNGLPNFDKRNPTIINAIFNRNDLKCELICDKAHVASEAILNTYKILGSNQIMIISDSLLTKGLSNGQYKIWGIKVDKRNLLDYLHGTNKIAGGNLPYDKQVENFGQITKCSMNEILKVSSLNAAKSIHQDHRFGNLIKGANSSFVLLDKNYKLKMTIINGQLVK